MKLKIKLPLATLLCGLVILMMFVSSYIVLLSQKEDGAKINLAGRQRMLSQKITKEFATCFLIKDKGGDLQESKKTLQNSIRVFDVSLKALKEGGKIPLTLNGDNNTFVVVPKSSEEITKQFVVVEKIWGQLKDALTKGIAKGFISYDDLAFVQSNNMVLLKESNVAVLLMQESAESRIFTLKLIQLVGLVIGVLCVFWSFYVVFGVLKKLQKTNMMIAKYSEGDLTARIQVDVKDEIDETLDSVSRLGDNIASIISEIYSANNTLLGVTTEFSKQFSVTAQKAESMKASSLTVASATEEASVSVKEISTNVGESAESVNTIAVSIEEMSATINEVAQSCKEEARLAQQANAQIQQSLTAMETLNNSGQEIGRIVSVINDIADQTNLLALNATIEAASAGEAGKGFAVVASEVKNLANQTSNSTGQIRKQIEDMQEQTRASVDSITEIVKVIEKVNEISNAIVVAMDEQTSVVNEASGNISVVNTSSQAISQNALETAVGVEEVSSSMGTVNFEIDEIVSTIVDSEKQIAELQDLAKGLSDVVSVFKIEQALLVWDDKYSVGIADYDSDHKVLINMINDLNAALVAGNSKTAVEKILDELVQYTAYHFGNEEEGFKKYQYPDTDAHIELHRKFVKTVLDFQKDFSAGKALMSKDIMLFLKDWLVDHIMGVDQRYSKFFNEKGMH